VFGRWRAYCTARWLALAHDNATRHLSGSDGIGIRWQVVQAP
jgi:hypothetical protein